MHLIDEKVIQCPKNGNDPSKSTCRQGFNLTILPKRCRFLRSA